MARKPNYRFERHERERIKAAKKAARAEAKAAKKVKPEGEAGEGTADGATPEEAAAAAEDQRR